MNKVPSFLSPFVELQKLDIEKEKVEKLLQSIPNKIRILEDKIVGIKREQEIARDQFRSLEHSQREVENRVQDSYNQINKYKNQQMLVKKNEEYQALESEISILRQRIELGETEEIEILYKIDLEKENLVQSEQAFLIKIGTIEEDIKQNQNTFSELIKKKENLTENIQHKRRKLDSNLLTDYDQIHSNIKKLPIISEIKHQICDGCHLKVSQEVMGRIKDHHAVHHCDQCGRIVY